MTTLAHAHEPSIETPARWLDELERPCSASGSGTVSNCAVALSLGTDDVSPSASSELDPASAPAAALEESCTKTICDALAVRETECSGAAAAAAPPCTETELERLGAT